MRKLTVKRLALYSLGILVVGFAIAKLFQVQKWYYIYIGEYKIDFEGVILTIVFFPAVILLTSLILLFRPQSIFHSWLRFAKYYLPIALLLILISSDTGGGMFIGFGGGFDREGMIWFTAGLFFVISLLLIIIKSWKLRGKKA